MDGIPLYLYINQIITKIPSSANTRLFLHTLIVKNFKTFNSRKHLVQLC